MNIRDKKDLLKLNIKDLTQEEIDNLVNIDLACCDKCGTIDNSEELWWLGYMNKKVAERLIPKEIVNKTIKRLETMNYSAVCDKCLVEISKNYENKNK